ncbi:MAG: hypothetical protein COB08_015825 [Rhodobacteraceae bacterium]|nr:hypothetical protein [Paracoccaceae bacterium]
MNMRLYFPSLATLFAFSGLAISILFLQSSMDDQESFQSLEPTSLVTSAASTAPITLDESVEAVDIYPLTARPLFSPIRRVPEVIVPAAIELDAPTPPAINQTPQPEALPPPELVMIGILLDGPTPKALIRNAHGTERWVQTGDTIEGWQVVRISTLSITLQLNDESVDIYSID